MRVDPLAYLGRYTLSIYLLNTIVIGVVKLMLLETIGWSHDRFPLAFAILLATGVVGPVLVKQILFRRVPWLDRITT
jgi:fucose 4-O-acetylase-like acetyltransferase